MSFEGIRTEIEIGKTLQEEALAFVFKSDEAAREASAPLGAGVDNLAKAVTCNLLVCDQVELALAIVQEQTSHPISSAAALGRTAVCLTQAKTDCGTQVVFTHRTLTVLTASYEHAEKFHSHIRQAGSLATQAARQYESVVGAGHQPTTIATQCLEVAQPVHEVSESAARTADELRAKVDGLTASAVGLYQNNSSMVDEVQQSHPEFPYPSRPISDIADRLRQLHSGQRELRLGLLEAQLLLREYRQLYAQCPQLIANLLDTLAESIATAQDVADRFR